MGIQRLVGTSSSSGSSSGGASSLPAFEVVAGRDDPTKKIGAIIGGGSQLVGGNAPFYLPMQQRYLGTTPYPSTATNGHLDILSTSVVGGIGANTNSNVNGYSNSNALAITTPIAGYEFTMGANTPYALATRRPALAAIPMLKTGASTAPTLPTTVRHRMTFYLSVSDSYFAGVNNLRKQVFGIVASGRTGFVDDSGHAIAVYYSCIPANANPYTVTLTFRNAATTATIFAASTTNRDGWYDLDVIQTNGSVAWTLTYLDSTGASTTFTGTDTNGYWAFTSFTMASYSLYMAAPSAGGTYTQSMDYTSLLRIRTDIS